VPARSQARVLFVLLTAVFTGCASTGGSRPPASDLTRARAAVEDARGAGAAAQAAEQFTRAEGKLQEAEAAAQVRGRERDAQVAADLAEAEARGAAAVARAAARRVKEKQAITADLERLNARLRRAEEEHKRLEDRVALLTRDLELTETELIRSKARLQGNESKAEASAAIAEARILVSRLANDKGRTAAVIRAEESLAKAEEQLFGNNFGASIFFASKAQDTVKKAQEGDVPEAEAGTAAAPPVPAAMPTPAPAPVPAAGGARSWEARVDVNIRKGPANAEPVVGTARAGATLAGTGAVRHGWVEVTYGGVTGWTYSTLLR
jgi:hypothetical protein